MFVVYKNTVRGVIDILGLVLFYGFVFWRIFKGNRGNKVIECGSITLIVFIVWLVQSSKFPSMGISMVRPLALSALPFNDVFLSKAGIPRSAPPQGRMKSAI
jgi:hypothetical protein